MNKNQILSAIKENNYTILSNYLQEGGDCGLVIRGKDLLSHAILCGSRDLIYLLLLYGPELEGMKKIKYWEDKLYVMNPDLMTMVGEIEASRMGVNPNYRCQMILEDASRMMLGEYPSSYRHTCQHVVREKSYFTKLMVGIHLYEYQNWKFLSGAMGRIYQCEEVSKMRPRGKFAMILRASVLDEYPDQEFLGLNLRIKGFLEFIEVPISQLEFQIKKLNERKALIVGVHFSDEPSLVVDHETVDIHHKFFDSMKNIIGLAMNPRYEEETVTFESLRDWDKQLDQMAKDFRKQHGYWPNILLASSATYSRIDMIANARGKNRLKNTEGTTATDEEFVSMSGFQGSEYSLDFCIDESLGVDTVRLIFDSDPDGGLPLPGELFVRKVA